MSKIAYLLFVMEIMRERERDRVWETKWAVLHLARSWGYFCLNAIGQNSVMWSHLDAKGAGKIKPSWVGSWPPNALYLEIDSKNIFFYFVDSWGVESLLVGPMLPTLLKESALSISYHGGQYSATSIHKVRSNKQDKHQFCQGCGFLSCSWGEMLFNLPTFRVRFWCPGTIPTLIIAFCWSEIPL